MFYPASSPFCVKPKNYPLFGLDSFAIFLKYIIDCYATRKTSVHAVKSCNNEDKTV